MTDLITVLLVEPGQAPRITQIGNDLTSMQAVVGGPIQAVYPFDFKLCVNYKLDGCKILISYTVINLEEEKKLPFEIGFHPAFNCPLNSGESFDDYYVEFDEDEHITQNIGGEEVVLVEYGKRLDMTRALFDNDSIPLEMPNSRAISLRSGKDGSFVRLEYPVSDCITVWSPTGDDRAQFVCLEPWTSVPTFYDDDFDAIEDKPHAIKLGKGETYKYYYDIKLF